MSDGPDFDRLASVLKHIALRMVMQNDDEQKGGPNAHSGVLSRVNGRTG